MSTTAKTKDRRRTWDGRRINNSLTAAAAAPLLSPLLQKGSLYFETLKRRLIGRLVERRFGRGTMTDRERARGQWTVRRRQLQ